jgi:hypothetical protein
MTHRLRFFILAAALALSGPALAGKPLFRGESVPASRAASKAVADLAGKPDTFAVKVVKADPGVVAAATREIELELGTRRVNLVQKNAHGTASGSLVWIGHVRETAR